MKQQQRQQQLMSRTPSKQKKETLAKKNQNRVALHTKKKWIKNYGITSATGAYR
jgi:hypothetical protein